jgi:glycosyltransferase involved in cell wall biosynthesis
MSQPLPPESSARTQRAASREPRAAAPQALPADFAVIVPAFDEVENVPDLVAELKATWERHDLGGEVIVVDDGSTDGTWEALTAEAGAWPRLRVLRHRRNLGKTEALLTAADATEAEYLVLFDADLQHSPEEIPRFLERLGEGWDIVTGRKIGAYEKQAVSGTYNRISRKLFDLPVGDLNSMKAFRSEVLQSISLRHDWHRFFVVLAYERGYTVTEIDIELYPRRAGESKYTGFGRVLIGVADLVVVWFNLRFGAKPMQFFGGTGALFILLGIVVGLIAIVLRVGGWMPPFGYRPLLTLVLLLESVGVVLFGVGFLAELVAALRAEVVDLRRRIMRGGGGR